jgi:hypothetical protein
MCVSCITLVDVVETGLSFGFVCCYFFITFYVINFIYFIIRLHSVHIAANSLHERECSLHNLISCLSQTVPFYPKLYCIQVYVCILSSCNFVLNC